MIFMTRPFRHVALFGKYQAQGIRAILEDVAHFITDQGLDVYFDR